MHAATTTSPARIDERPVPRVLPLYVLVLLVLVAVAVVLGHGATATFEAARSSRSFPADARHVVIFAALFNAAVSGGLAFAWALELVATPFRLARQPPQKLRALARLVVASVPLGAFALGHVATNPWLVSLASQARAAFRL